MIYIASDHAGVDMKLAIMKHLDSIQVEYFNFGTDEPKSVDYPDFAHALCQEMNEDDWGILICGTGIGMSMVANRYDHIRCAVVTSGQMAEVARQHNDANAIAIGARIIDNETAIKFVDIFLNTQWEAGRHVERVEKINIPEYEPDEPPYTEVGKMWNFIERLFPKHKTTSYSKKQKMCRNHSWFKDEHNGFKRTCEICGRHEMMEGIGSSTIWQHIPWRRYE